MRPLTGAIRHASGAMAEALLLAAIVAALALALSPVYAPANYLAGTDRALASQLGTITVDMGSGASGPTKSSGSIFTASGCGFRANDTHYAMVVYGPAVDTASYGYWVDSFRVGANGCGSSIVTWTSSGVAGTFQVWVARSPSGSFTTARPASNVVRVTITDP
jgi:hypothetical protein